MWGRAFKERGHVAATTGSGTRKARSSRRVVRNVMQMLRPPIRTEAKDLPRICLTDRAEWSSRVNTATFRGVQKYPIWDMYSKMEFSYASPSLSG